MKIFPKEYSTERLCWLIMNSIIWIYFSYRSIEQIKWINLSSGKSMVNYLEMTNSFFIGLISFVLFILALGIIIMKLKSKIKMVPDTVPYLIILVDEIIVVIISFIVFFERPIVFPLTIVIIIVVNLCLLAWPIEKKFIF
jgi:hypothetical protein